MKELNIVWDKVTTHSRFWALVIFLGVLPALAFYAGIRTEKLHNEQESLTIMSQQTIFKSEHGMCRVSDCTLQPLSGIYQNSAKALSSEGINIISPKKGDHIDPKAPMKVMWNITPTSSISRLSILLLDSNGKAVIRPVVVPVSSSSASIILPKNISQNTYFVLIQAVDSTGATKNTPFVYSGDFYL